jgi:hypothetical protein
VEGYFCCKKASLVFLFSSNLLQFLYVGSLGFCSLTKQGGGDDEDPDNPESEAAGAHYVW